MINTTGRLIALFLAAAMLLTACSQGEDQGSQASSQTPESASASGSDSGTSEESIPVLGEFTATDLDGNPVDQSIFEGYDLTMVNIWATFCGPCLQEMPDLGVLNKEYQDRGFQIVGIVSDTLNQDGTISESQVEVAKEAVKTTGADYLHLLPSEDLIGLLLWQVTSVPTTIFVDKDGSLVGVGYLGSRDADAWREIIEEKLTQVQEAGK
jgi:thiol-disulfide isomerase/thioredoxin